MDFDRVGGQFSTELRMILLDRGLRDNVSRPAHQQGEQSPLARTQVEYLSPGAYLARGLIEHESADLDGRLTHVTRAPQKSADSGEQFEVMEGLDEIVIRSAVESSNSVVDPCARRDDEDRCLAASRPQLVNQ